MPWLTCRFLDGYFTLLILLLILAVLLVPGAPAASPPAPAQLRVEYLENPLGVDVPQPRFSWILPMEGRDQQQAAYQILVSLSPEVSTGDVWDSGRVNSNAQQVAYAGKPLQSGTRYYWKVRYWDQRGQASPFSSVAFFETGLLQQSDWKGKWISGGNQFRKEFRLDEQPTRARAYVAGIGYYELRINGQKVGDHVLDPGWTTFEKRVLYSTYDVTPYLRQGPNCIGLLVGQGWYGKREAILQLNIQLASGRTMQVVSDTSWKVTQGPIVSDSVWDGEVYDARKETPGWDQPGFNDSSWQAASTVSGPGGVLSAQLMPPIKVIDTLVPRRLLNPRPGVWVFDMGQNMTGWVQLRVRGPRGTIVRIRHAELAYEDGSINVENLRAARATDTYILRGDPEGEIYEPRFTYHGFRYVELTGLPGTPGLDTIRARLVHTAVRPTGGFSCSNQLLNDIHKMIVWGTRTNLHSIPTDCPQRNERMGWLGDAHLAAETAIANFDMAAFYTNFLRNIRDVQSEDGAVTDTVPHRYGRRPADPAWGSAYPLLVWYLYLHYGDRRVVEQHFDGVKAWADFLHSRARDGILEYSYYGDWVPIEPTPGDLVSTFYYYWSTDLVARFADLLGRKDEASIYRQRASLIRDAFHKRFYDPQRRVYGPGNQASLVFALYLDLAPKEVQGAVFSRLTQNIVYENNTHLTTGILATKYLLPLLTARGRADLAYELAAQDTYPSWGYMIRRGATTIWELWQEKTGPSMNSHNHPMFGSVDAWFYAALAGINPDPEEPGYRHILIQPQMVRDLNWASGSLETPYGPVLSRWERTPERISLEVVIPAGCRATVYLPKLPYMRQVTLEESGRPVWKSGQYQPGVEGVRKAEERRQDLVVEIGSGHYRFVLTDEAL